MSDLLTDWFRTRMEPDLERTRLEREELADAEANGEELFYGLLEHLERHRAEQEKPITSREELSAAVTETVAIALCAFTTQSINPREDMHEMFACDPFFRHRVNSLTAELMRVFGRYDPQR